jgi:hypothetical protein
MTTTASTKTKSNKQDLSTDLVQSILDIAGKSPGEIPWPKSIVTNVIVKLICGVQTDRTPKHHFFMHIQSFSKV